MIDGRAMVSNSLKKETQHARAYRQRHGRGERRGEKQNDFGITASRLSSDFNARICNQRSCLHSIAHKGLAHCCRIQLYGKVLPRMYVM